MSHPTDRPTAPLLPRLGGVLLALALAAAGCSGGDDEAAPAARSSVSPDAGASAGESSGGAGETAASGAGDQEPDRATAGEAESAVPGQGPGPASDPVTDVVGVAALGRSIIHTADLEVEVDDVAAATRQAHQVVAAAGGLLFGQDTTTDPSPRTVLTFKVPPARLAEALGQLEGLGRLQRQQISADDVTEQVVDLRSRITTAEVSVARLRALLDQAGTLEQIAALESQLLTRETDLERLRGQLRTLEDLVELATINLELREPVDAPALEAAVTGYVADDGDGGNGVRCPGDDEIDLEEGQPLVVCVTVVNTGTTGLSDIEVRDAGLGLRPADFRIAGPAGAEVLAPGEQQVWWAVVGVEPSHRLAPQVSAVPVTSQGIPLQRAVETTIEAAALDVRPDDSLPGFTDAVRAGAGVLGRMWGLAVVVVGASVPFLWLVPLAVVGRRRWARRRVHPTPPPPPVVTAEA